MAGYAAEVEAAEEHVVVDVEEGKLSLFLNQIRPPLASYIAFCLGSINTFLFFSGLGRRGRSRTTSKEKAAEAEEETTQAEEDEEMGEEEEEEEMRIPGMPSKPCPSCDERFTTREGFLEHVVTHSSKRITIHTIL